MLTNLDRRETFFNDLLAVQSFGVLSYSLNQTIVLTLRGGLSYWIYTGKVSELSNELNLAQSLQVHYNSEIMGGYLGITGKYKVSRDNPEIIVRDITQFRGGISYGFDGWLAEFYISTPLTNRPFLETSYGIKVIIGI